MLKQRADPILCSFGSLLAVPLLFLSFYLPRIISIYLLWFIIGVAVTGLALSWTLYADMTMYMKASSFQFVLLSSLILN
jgi:hypothetical protein